MDSKIDDKARCLLSDIVQFEKNTDGRFHNLRKDMEGGFRDVDKRFDELKKNTDKRFDDVDHRLTNVDHCLTAKINVVNCKLKNFKAFSLNGIANRFVTKVAPIRKQYLNPKGLTHFVFPSRLE
jgi:hypothetical protein